METSSPIIKIFAGFRLTPDIREVISTLDQPLSEVQLVTYQGKEYIGFYICPKPAAADVKEVHDKIHSLLCDLFYPARFITPAFSIFPQIFLA